MGLAENFPSTFEEFGLYRAQAPALGRADIGPAARQRKRDLVIQTEAFVHDPAGTLPHYRSGT